MLCNLAVCSKHDDNGPSYIRFALSAGLHKVHPARVEKVPRDAQPRKLCSKSWRVGASTEVLTKAMRALEDPLSMTHFVDIAANVQISFEAPERADIYLFD
jgi:hypothetical protein